MHGAVADEEDVGPRRLGDVAAVIGHQRIVVAGPLGLMLGEGADQIEARRLGVHRGHVRRRLPPLGVGHPNALLGGLGVEVAGPVPRRHGDMDLGLAGGHAGLLRAAPGDRADIGAVQPLAGHRVLAGLFDLGHAERHVEI